MYNQLLISLQIEENGVFILDDEIEFKNKIRTA